MKKKLVLMMFAAVFALTACTSQKKIESDDDFSVEADAGSDSGGDDLSLDGGGAGSDSGQQQAQDDLSLDAFNEDSGGGEKAKPEAAASEPAQDADLALEDELSSLGGEADNKAAAQQNAGTDELSLDEPAQPTDQAAATQQQQPPAEGDLELPPEVAVGDAAAAPQDPAMAQNLTQAPDQAAAQTPPPAVEAAPITAEAAANVSVPANITNVQYKGNDAGGTVAISADQPLTYTTRFNQTTNQFVVEVQNSSIPKKLKRSLNTKDMASSIGSVDIYQKEGSSVSRFVVQLRAGSPEPIVQPEGNSLLIVGGTAGGVAASVGATTDQAAPADQVVPPETIPTQAAGAVDQAPESVPQEIIVDSSGAAKESTSKSSEVGKLSSRADDDDSRPTSPVTGLLNYENLEEFLMSNTKFYGKKISIETTDMDTADALKFLAEESGVNIMFDDNLGTMGKVNIKLKEVPWDQAFVLILKAKNLAYKRQGNVIRIATVDKILEDEDKAIKLKQKKRKPEDYLVKRFFVGYIKATEAKTKVSEYIDNFQKIKAITASAAGGAAAQQEAKGSIIVDDSNNSLIVTDTAENIKKVEEILAAIDIQPKQIQIEAKIVDANENFAKGLGVKWNVTKSAGDPSGSVGFLQGGSGGGSVTTSGQLTGALTWANLDFLGTLTANIALGESQGKLKTLASPRITVISGKQANLQQLAKVEVPTTVINQDGTPTSSVKSEDVRLGIIVTPTATNEGTVSLQVNISRDTGGGGAQVVQRSAQTELFVRSGATAVVGGIYETVINSNQEGLPGLSSVPVFGSLFRAKQDTKSKTELMIFLTPTILRGI